MVPVNGITPRRMARLQTAVGSAEAVKIAPTGYRNQYARRIKRPENQLRISGEPDWQTDVEVRAPICCVATLPPNGGKNGGHVKIDTKGLGDMAFRALEAPLDCGFTSTGIDFKWNGADEGDQVAGDGWDDLRDDGCLEGEIAYHNGDETTFIAVPWARFSAPC
jgi:hypothetical protein